MTCWPSACLFLKEEPQSFFSPVWGNKQVERRKRRKTWSISLLLLQNKSPLTRSLRSPWGSAASPSPCVCVDLLKHDETQKLVTHSRVLSRFLCSGGRRQQVVCSLHVPEAQAGCALPPGKKTTRRRWRSARSTENGITCRPVAPNTCHSTKQGFIHSLLKIVLNKCMIFLKPYILLQSE